MPLLGFLSFKLCYVPEKNRPFTANFRLPTLKIWPLILKIRPFIKTIRLFTVTTW